jgi:hypothetical protein
MPLNCPPDLRVGRGDYNNILLCALSEDGFERNWEQAAPLRLISLYEGIPCAFIRENSRNPAFIDKIQAVSLQ